MRYNEIKPLMEINMSPSNLKQMVSGIDATIGIEFEMYIPQNVTTVTKTFNRLDSPVKSIFNIRNNIGYNPLIIEFFDSTQPEITIRVLDSIKEKYDEYIDKLVQEDMDMGFFVDYVEKRLHDEEYEDHYEEQAMLELGYQKDMTPHEIEKIVNRLIKQDAANLERINPELNSELFYRYTKRMDKIFRDSSYRMDDFLMDNDIATMSGIFNQYKSYGLKWPTYSNSHTKNHKPMKLAKIFGNYVNSTPVVSAIYHGSDADSRGVKWIIEPDASLRRAGNKTHGGWEFVSPKMPISQMLTTLEQIKNFALDNNCFTNESCGLHINLSINDNMHNLDYMKLVLLLGDNYILDQFARKFNENCESAIDSIHKNVKVDDVHASLNDMKNDLEVYSKQLYLRNAYRKSSVNAKNRGRIEFRAPGGDWLGILNSDPGKITNTIMRMAVALDAATDKNKYRNEYIKKFYKLITTTNSRDTDILRDFILYATGEINTESLKSRLVNRQKWRQYDKDLLSQLFGEMDDVLNTNN